MSVTTIKIAPRDLGKFEERFPGEMKSLQRRVMHDFGNQAKNMLGVKSIDVDYKGRFRTGWRFKTTPNGKKLVIWNKEPHAYWVEHGRAPGKWPPKDVITEWCIFRFGETKKTPTQVFLVRRKVGRRGVDGRPVLTDLDTEIFLTDNLMRQLNRLWDKAAKKALFGQHSRSKGLKSGLPLFRAKGHKA